MQSPRALLAALHRAAVGGAAPYPRTHRAASAWWRTDALGAAPAGGATRRLHLFALGKASPAMAAGAAQAAREAGIPVAGGVVVAAAPIAAPALPAPLPESLTTCVGDHPVPGPASLAAADAITRAVAAVQPGDTAMVLLSGGTTALCAAPVAAFAELAGGVERAQARLANLADTLLESGLAIHEMNAIRRRVLRWGAGRLAVALAARGAAAIPTFAISDVIGDDPAVIGSGPCTPDPLDDGDFLALLDAHDLRRSLERDTAAFLGALGAASPPAVPAPGHPAFARVTYRCVARNADALGALADAARDAGIDEATVADDPLQGEAAALGDQLARQALDVARRTPRQATRLLVWGGEPVVHLRAALEQAWADGEAADRAADAVATAMADATGSADWDALLGAGDGSPRRPPGTADEPLRGGRMQALALAAALALEEAAARGDRAASRVWCLAAGTDGRDGPTDAAGAIVDLAVPMLARRHGRAPERDLVAGRSWFPLDAAGALLRTGPTGTNVMDVVALLVAPAPGRAAP